MSRVLVTGAIGYIGSVLTNYLRGHGHNVHGMDIGFFQDCTIHSFQDEHLELKDVRKLDESDLENVDAVVHLAGISNDPFGDLSPEKVYDPTLHYTIDIAKMCKRKGIKFIFASSCSIYGKGSADLLSETSEVFPQTPYSVNKLQIEEALKEIADTSFTPICLRFATAYGFSPRLRFDLYIHMLVGMALTTGKIVLNSDGKAWRPNVHVQDICKSIRYAVESNISDSQPIILNVGTTSENFQIIEVSKMIQAKIPGCGLEYLKDTKSDTDAEYVELIKDRKLNQDHVDSRTYKISFEKIREVFPGFECDWTVEKGIDELISKLQEIQLEADKFKDFRFYRLQKIDNLYRSGKIDANLSWV